LRRNDLKYRLFRRERLRLSAIRVGCNGYADSVFDDARLESVYLPNEGDRRLDVWVHWCFTDLANLKAVLKNHDNQY